MTDLKRPARGRIRVSNRSRATIPVEALRKAGLQPGDELVVQVEGDGRIVLERPAAPRPRRTLEMIEKYAGSGAGDYPPGYLDELRNEWR